MRYSSFSLVPLILLLSACSSKPAETAPEPKGGFLLQPEHQQVMVTGDYAYNPEAEKFINKMVAEHGFDRHQLHEIFSQTKKLDYVLRLMDRQAPTTAPPAGPNGAWLRYREKFITPDNVQNGVNFWNQYQSSLERAHREYGVPPEIIVGIIGVETRWGRVMGKTRIIDALSTLSFSYPRRAKYFSGELETFLLMSRQEQVDPLSLKGSFAGAMGYGQFMPTSFKEYAVDFNGDGHVNLWNAEDAIGSVANYFKAHGWKPGQLVALPVNGQAPGLAHGFNTKYRVAALQQSGLDANSPLDAQTEVSLLRFDMGNRYQYWYGLPNFYTITRYNHSTHYAMAVWQLGQAVAAARAQ